MSDKPDRLEWFYLRIALGVVALIVVADVVGWKVHDIVHPPPTRLERTVVCLKDEKGVVAIVPAGDPISNTARAGSLRVTVEGSEVIVSLAKSEDEAAKIEGNYRAVAGNLEGRLERRGRSVFLWQGVASPTQRQTMYDCQY
jgi:hypothetical protein